MAKIKKLTIRDTRKVMASRNIFARRLHKGSKWYLFRMIKTVEKVHSIGGGSIENHNTVKMQTLMTKQESKVRFHVYVAARFPTEAAAYNTFLLYDFKTDEINPQYKWDKR